MGIEAVLAVAGAGVSAIGALQQGQAQSKMAAYNAQVAENAAAQERQAAVVEQEQHSDRLRRLISGQKARAGASGTTVGTGSNLLTAVESAEEGELDRLRIGYGGEVKALRQESQAALDRAQARQARTGSYYTAGASLLTGASRAKF